MGAPCKEYTKSGSKLGKAQYTGSFPFVSKQHYVMQLTAYETCVLTKGPHSPALPTFPPPTWNSPPGHRTHVRVRKVQLHTSNAQDRTRHNLPRSLAKMIIKVRNHNKSNNKNSRSGSRTGNENNTSFNNTVPLVFAGLARWKSP